MGVFPPSQHMFRGHGAFTLVPLVVGWSLLGLASVLFITFRDRIFLGVARGRFFPDVVLSASSSQGLQHIPEQFAAESEAAGSQWKSMAYPLWVVGKCLPQEEEFKYLRVLYSEGKDGV